MGEKNDRHINVRLSIVDRRINSIYGKYLLRRYDSNPVYESVGVTSPPGTFLVFARTNRLEMRVARPFALLLLFEPKASCQDSAVETASNAGRCQRLPFSL